MVNDAVAITKEKENQLLKRRIANIEYLQDNYVPINIHQTTEKELAQAKILLECEKQDTLYYMNMAQTAKKNV